MPRLAVHSSRANCARDPTYRGQKVMLDRDFAALYGVTTGKLNKAIRRNRERLSADCMFQLNVDEAENMRFQNGISRL